MIGRIQRIERWLKTHRIFAYTDEVEAIINDEVESPALATNSTYSASKIEELIANIPTGGEFSGTLDDITDGTTYKKTTQTEKNTYNGKQDALVSGTNIKTINSNSILGSGDLVVSGSPTVATGAEVDAGTDNTKMVTPKAMEDSSYSKLALGETSGTAYRGDRGKTAYEHSQTTHAPTDFDDVYIPLVSVNGGVGGGVNIVEKTNPPADDDIWLLYDSEENGNICGMKHSTLKAYLDTLYQPLGH